MSQANPAVTDSILRLDTAVPLVTALVITRSREHNIRILATKGPSLHLHGLRPSQVSTDVDILVHPDDVERTALMLGQDNWRRLNPLNLEYAHVPHAIALVHPFWPCMIDVHKFWAGVLEEPGAAFDALWNNRASFTIAGCDVPVPSFVDSGLLYALHELRGTPIQQESPVVASVASILKLRLGEDGSRAACLASATMLGAIDTAAPLLEACGIAPASLSPHEKSEGLLDFENRRRGKAGSVTSWIHRVSAASWRRRVGLVVEALALRPSHLRQLHPETKPGITGYVAGLFHRWSRWGRVVLQQLRSKGAKGG